MHELILQTHGLKPKLKCAFLRTPDTKTTTVYSCSASSYCELRILTAKLKQ